MVTRSITAAAILPALLSCASATPPTNTTFVAFDLETTGLSAKTHRIIEIGAVKFRNGRSVGTFSTLVAPGMPIPAASQRVHGITDEMVREAPQAREALQRFLEFVGNAVLLAHNAAFDLRFISAEAERNRVKLGKLTVIDTLPLARRWFPHSEGHSLAALAKHLSLPAAKSHRALADARRVRLVFLAGLATEDGDVSLRDLTPDPRPLSPAP